MELQPFEEDDYGGLYGFMLPLWEETYGGILSPEHLNFLMNRYFSPAAIAAFRAEGYRYLKITDGGVIGAVVYVERDGDTYLDKLYLTEEARGKGVAAFVFRELLRLGRDLTLNVNRNNARAVACYKKNGFAVEETQSVVVADGMINEDYFMRLKKDRTE